jgi:hypothetical protein
MKRTILRALAMASMVAAANAADWTPPKVPDPLPDSLTWNGITFYATLDYGYGIAACGGHWPRHHGRHMLTAEVGILLAG